MKTNKSDHGATSSAPTHQVNLCRCGAELPTVPDDETPFEFCSEQCKDGASRNDTKIQEEIRQLSEELKNLFFYEPHNEVAINHIVGQLDKLRAEVATTTT